MEAIVLCGGLGSRLRSVVSGIPKPMAQVNGKPFLEYVFEYLKLQGIKKVVLAVSYRSEVIQDYFGNCFLDIEVEYSFEKELLGTGGAIRQALGYVAKNCFVLNGDTFFPIHFKKLKLQESKICLALKKKYNFDRYGAVKIDQNGFVQSFNEKEFLKEGLINGGIYLVAKDIFEDFSLPDKFSFEEFLQKHFRELFARAEIFDEYFIDIGIPEDYRAFEHTIKES
ncbi:nucleotidyltransferase family protein [Helicobacter sp.]|uniref:D-glycero-D-manno-heptose 1-phosphate guanosyltransferase n=1 Tax=Helicobacter sp. TaxID=218 RepID=UPI0025BDAC5B|nr:nucleotidyltransferase family protein [Helicobacter sp.]MCI5968554.1 nucleotidyltransferase family protein [Helicobacter sp.]MDY2584764.1 nucleotidyltransferase family protein [Helicobacter sp.]